MSLSMTNHMHAPTTLDGLLRWRADAQPERVLHTFLVDGEAQTETLTFGALDTRARTIAARIQAEIAPGDRVLLLYQPGVEYVAGFYGCLYAGAIAVPAYPPDPARLGRTLPRLLSLIDNAGVSLIISTTPIKQLGEFIFAEHLAGRPIRWLATDTLDASLAEQWRAPHTDAKAIAFLQYTSGSTANPKGVILTHDNLMANLASQAYAMDLSPDSRVISWLPPYHDMGLIGTLLQPAYQGCQSILMSPTDFLQRPLRWLRAITRFGGTVAGGPNFGYELCVRKFDPDRDGATIDLSSLRVLFNGAEPIRGGTIRRFTETFAPFGFRPEAFFPCYGLAEATLIASGMQAGELPHILPVDAAALQRDRVAAAGDAPARLLVSSGRTLPEHEIAIIDSARNVASADGAVGEIWLRGPSISPGYWENPEATATTFNQTRADTGEGGYLRTGDLGFMQGDHVFVTGRTKDLIIIHGQNHYPQDIERTVELSHPGLRPGCTAAFSVEENGIERLVVVQEVKTTADLELDTLFGAIRRAVADAHGVETYTVALIEPRSIYKTSSGKIQRGLTRLAYLNGELETIATDTLKAPAAAAAPAAGMVLEMLALVEPEKRPAALATYLRHQVAQLLGQPVGSIDPEMPLGNYGINSVKAVELSDIVQEAFGRLLPATFAYDYPTIAAMAAYLLDEAPASTSAADAVTAVVDDLSDLSDDEALAQLLAELDSDS